MIPSGHFLFCVLYNFVLKNENKNHCMIFFFSRCFLSPRMGCMCMSICIHTSPVVGYMIEAGETALTQIPFAQICFWVSCDEGLSGILPVEARFVMVITVRPPHTTISHLTGGAKTNLLELNIVIMFFFPIHSFVFLCHDVSFFSSVYCFFFFQFFSHFETFCLCC